LVIVPAAVTFRVPATMAFPVTLTRVLVAGVGKLMFKTLEPFMVNGPVESVPLPPLPGVTLPLTTLTAPLVVPVPVSVPGDWTLMSLLTAELRTKVPSLRVIGPGVPPAARVVVPLPVLVRLVALAAPEKVIELEAPEVTASVPVLLTVLANVITPDCAVVRLSPVELVTVPLKESVPPEVEVVKICPVPPVPRVTGQLSVAVLAEPRTIPDPAPETSTVAPPAQVRLELAKN
jgi:hypothetical protein